MKKKTLLFEHHSEKPISKHAYRWRILKYLGVTTTMLILSLTIGMLGYMYIVGVKTWADAFLNASMILTGMGPILDPELHLSDAAKIFSGLYAIYSGVAFLSSIAIFFAPIVHRFFHLMHLDVEDN